MDNMLVICKIIHNTKYLFIDGSKVLTSSRDNTLKIVDLRSYEVVQTLQ